MGQKKGARDCKDHKEVMDTSDLRGNKNATQSARTRKNRRKLGPQPVGGQEKIKSPNTSGAQETTGRDGGGGGGGTGVAFVVRNRAVRNSAMNELVETERTEMPQQSVLVLKIKCLALFPVVIFLRLISYLRIPLGVAELFAADFISCSNPRNEWSKRR